MDISFLCSKCGQPLTIDESGAGQLVDCPKCGTAVEVPYKSRPPAPVGGVHAPTQPAQTNLKACPFCAEQIKAEATICRFCGFDLVTGKPTRSQAVVPPATTSSASRKTVAIIAVFATLTIVCAFVFMFWTNKQKEAKAAEQARIEAAQAEANAKAQQAAREAEKKLIQQAQEAEAQKRVFVKGSVFIVTKGGVNYKLGLVSLGLIATDKLNQHLEAAFGAIESELNNQQTAFTSSMASVAQAEKAFKMADAAYGKLYEQFWEWRQYLEKIGLVRDSTYELARAGANTADFQKGVKVFLAAEVAYVHQGKQVQVLYDRYNKVIQEADIIRAKIGGIIDGHMDAIFATMPAVEVAKTDADGAFTFELPRTSNLVLVARGKRIVGENSERYFWLVPFSTTATDEQKTLLLSNDNMTESIPSKSRSLTAFLPDKPPKVPYETFETQVKGYKVVDPYSPDGLHKPEAASYSSAP